MSIIRLGVLLTALFPVLLRAQATVTIYASYNFEDVSSAAALFSDSSGNRHNLSNVTALSYTASNLATTGGNYAFDASPNSAYANVWAGDMLNNTAPSASRWGIELLFKNPGSVDGILGPLVLTYSTQDSLSISYEPNGDKMRVEANGAGQIPSFAYVPGAWNSIAVVTDGNSTEVWLNYQNIATVSGTLGSMQRNWMIGYGGGGDDNPYYTGLIDNVNIFTYTGTFTAANLSAGGVGSPVPEPSTYAALLGAVALGLVAMRRRSQPR